MATTGLLKQISKQDALLRLSSLCARCEYCRADMTKKMQRWDLTDEEKSEIIEKLISEGFIDEHRYAIAFTRDKFQYNHWGIVKIRIELKKKHISESDIEDALAELSDGDTKEMLRRLIESKEKTVKAKSEYEKRAKLFRFALSKGFTYDQISEVL